MIDNATVFASARPSATVLLLGLAAACEPPPPHDDLWLEESTGRRALEWVDERNERTLTALQADPRFALYEAEAAAILTDPRRLPPPPAASRRLPAASPPRPSPATTSTTTGRIAITRRACGGARRCVLVHLPHRLPTADAASSSSPRGAWTLTSYASSTS